jgi:hypothetical protein
VDLQHVLTSTMLPTALTVGDCLQGMVVLLLARLPQPEQYSRRMMMHCAEVPSASPGHCGCCLPAHQLAQTFSSGLQSMSTVCGTHQYQGHACMPQVLGSPLVLPGLKPLLLATHVRLLLCLTLCTMKVEHGCYSDAVVLTPGRVLHCHTRTLCLIMLCKLTVRVPSAVLIMIPSLV